MLGLTKTLVVKANTILFDYEHLPSIEEDIADRDTILGMANNEI